MFETSHSRSNSNPHLTVSCYGVSCCAHCGCGVSANNGAQFSSESLQQQQQMPQQQRQPKQQRPQAQEGAYGHDTEQTQSDSDSKA